MKLEMRIRLLSDDGKKLLGEGPRWLLRRIQKKDRLQAAATAQGVEHLKAIRILGYIAKELLA